MNILALDIGKFNTVYCDYISETGEHEFGKVKTTPQAIHDLIVEQSMWATIVAIWGMTTSCPLEDWTRTRN